MSVRFVVGRAGTGKTYHCLEMIRAELEREPVSGPRLVLLVPEQASLQMEQALLARVQQGVIHRADVLSFQRLAFRVLETAADVSRQALSEPARAMVLRHLLAARRSELRYYRRLERMGGFVTRLEATITELIQEAIEPEELMQGGGADDANADQLRQAKLHDLQLIYRAYLDYLGTERLDPSQYLQAARGQLGRCGWLAGAQVWVDGFASFARQEALTLVALARLCAGMEITVLADPVVCSGAALDPQSWEAAQLFARTAGTFDELSRLFAGAGVELQEPHWLVPAAPPRFERAPALVRVEKRLFQDAGGAGSGEAGGGLEVQVAELPSRRLEVEYAVAQVARWVSAQGWRYRDLALIVRDLEPYHDLLAAALDRRGIPYFIDRRRPTAHHPLVELLRAAVGLAVEPYGLEPVRLALKTGLMPLDMQQADTLENYLLAQGVSGADAWQAGPWEYVARAKLGEEHPEPDTYELACRQEANTARVTLLEVFHSWLELAGREPAATGGQWSAALVDLLERLHVGETLERWALEAEADGLLDEAEQHRQVWRDSLSFLDDLAFALERMSLPPLELLAVLEAGLACFTLGLAPPMLDQVLVGSIERSRHPELRATVVLGFNDGVFPAIPSEDSILNDDDRDLLIGAGLTLRPPARRRVLDEALLCYVAFTRPRRALVVTYAAADDENKALRPSPYLAALRRALPGLEVQNISDPETTRDTWDLLVPADLAYRLASEFRVRPAQEQDQSEVRGRFNELYDQVRLSGTGTVSLPRVLVSLAAPPEAQITPAHAQVLLGGAPRLSVSQLESYAACPFQHFARYHLRLRERTLAPLEALDLGKVHHAVLEEFFNTLDARHAAFDELNDVELAAGLNDSCTRVAERLAGSGPLAGTRDAYALRGSAGALARVLAGQQSIAQAGRARPRFMELPFGFDEREGLPALVLTTASNRRIRLCGFVDRVDLVELADGLLGIVVDYKRTRAKRLDLTYVYHGLSLQLLTYALVLAECGAELAGRQIRPIAALYVTLTSAYHPQAEPRPAGAESGQSPGLEKPRGLICSEDFAQLDAEGRTGWSQHYSFYRKSDGEPGFWNQSDAAGGAAFAGALAYVRRRLTELAEDVLDGRIGVRPYWLKRQSPCPWCPLARVCGFEAGAGEWRYLESLKRSEVLERWALASSDSPNRDQGK